MKHPRCVGWGEIGLDYHYDNSPREIQQEVFTRQLRHAVRLGKPLTIHTREAEADTERILKAEVPQDYRVSLFKSPSSHDELNPVCPQIHIHCFTDSPEWAARMLEHFPNLFIGVTGAYSLQLFGFCCVHCAQPRCYHLRFEPQHLGSRPPDGRLEAQSVLWNLKSATHRFGDRRAVHGAREYILVAPRDQGQAASALPYGYGPLDSRVRCACRKRNRRILGCRECHEGIAGECQEDVWGVDASPTPVVYVTPVY